MHGYMHCILHVIFTYCVNIKIFFTIEGGGKFSEITSKKSFLRYSTGESSEHDRRRQDHCIW